MVLEKALKVLHFDSKAAGSEPRYTSSNNVPPIPRRPIPPPNVPEPTGPFLFKPPHHVNVTVAPVDMSCQVSP